MCQTASAMKTVYPELNYVTKLANTATSRSSIRRHREATTYLYHLRCLNCKQLAKEE